MEHKSLTKCQPSIYDDVPLDHAKREFRLLMLDTALIELDPCYTLHNFSLDGARPEFFALSYAWGDPRDTVLISVNGQSVLVTRNLQSALRHIQKVQAENTYEGKREDKPFYIWADALCINQDDDVEKSRQVAMMGEIFRNAGTVLVWLGSALEDRAKALEYLGSLPEMSQGFKLVNEVSFPLMRIPDLDATDVDSVVSKSNSILSDAITAGVGTLFDSKWFTRVWVVQEYTLAKNIQIHYGNQVPDEKNFKKAVEFVMALMQITGFTPELKNINYAWRFICHRSQFQLFNSKVFSVTEPKSFFEAAVSDFRDQDCGDDRDRVFGFLALSTDVPNIEPDYKKTTAEVYTNFAIKNLSYFTLFRAGLRRRGPIPDPQQSIVLDRNYLPSWCPDLRRYPESWEPVYGNYFATSTSDYGRIGWSRPNTNLAVLTAWGLGFDTVDKTEPRNADGNFAPTSNPQSFFAMIDHLKTIQGELPENYTIQLWRYSKWLWRSHWHAGFQYWPVTLTLILSSS